MARVPRKSTKKGTRRGKLVALPMQPSHDCQPPTFVNAAWVNHNVGLETFFIDLAVGPSPTHLDVKAASAAGFVQARTLASVMCAATFMPKLIQALQTQYAAYQQAKADADANKKA